MGMQSSVGFKKAINNRKEKKREYNGETKKRLTEQREEEGEERKEEEKQLQHYESEKCVKYVYLNVYTSSLTHREKWHLCHSVYSHT